MKSPRAEWVLFGAHFAALDYIRDRGEPDADTLSEVIRDTFQVHTRIGHIAFTAALTGAAVLFHRHICK